jgi:hypothetical protein
MNELKPLSELLLGLALFLGTHSIRLVSESARTRLIEGAGEKAYKLGYTALSLMGLGLIVHGFGVAREAPTVLWNVPTAGRHFASLLMLFAIILLVASFVPRNIFKAKLKHPMLLSVKVWALAHLLANGRLADLLLFGSFLLWAVLDFRALRQRDRAQAEALAGRPDGATMATAGAPTTSTPAGTVTAVVVGVALWALLLAYLHQKLFGVSPLGR